MERNNSLQLLVDYLLWLLVDSASSWKMSSSQIHVSPLFLSKNRSWQKTLGGNSRGTHVPKLSQKWISGPRPRLGQSRLITQPTLTYQNNYQVWAHIPVIKRKNINNSQKMGLLKTGDSLSPTYQVQSFFLSWVKSNAWSRWHAKI